MVIPFIEKDPFGEFAPYEGFSTKLKEIAAKLQRDLTVEGDEGPGKDDVTPELTDVLRDLPQDDSPTPPDADDSQCQIGGS
ncbi:hypothetical protein [Brevifollis gellanilyticus]|uniref:Uncharacterized protein n=1 Tax=Brevifollis gellanilyticus TaxID=748831 RepID=A0A512MCL3_9BACT|nr:hypothetical protein [Brevifollis gellanilyticus]GEP44480.1 hypothetical protein BGE01nite_37710 [Brevifollis gellanilyticus]